MFEINKNKAGEFVFRLKAANGQVIAVSHRGYETKDGVQNAIAAVCKYANPDSIADLTQGIIGMNSVAKQWIVKRKHLFGHYSYRLLVLLENGEYYISNGEVGEFLKVSEDDAEEMINRDL